MEVGAHPNGDFRFDNEYPRHRVYLDDFSLADRLVTNAEYAEFIAAGGYETPALWLSEGWAWRREHDVTSPMYWRHDDVWHEYRLDGERPLVANAPVTHVSYYEADAYARWAGARLATEMEWETAASERPAGGKFADGGLHPEAAASTGMAQLFGDCWEWTSSAYRPLSRLFAPLPARSASTTASSCRARWSCAAAPARRP